MKETPQYIETTDGDIGVPDEPDALGWNDETIDWGHGSDHAPTIVVSVDAEWDYRYDELADKRGLTPAAIHAILGSAPSEQLRLAEEERIRQEGLAELRRVGEEAAWRRIGAIKDPVKRKRAAIDHQARQRAEEEIRHRGY